MEEDREDEHPVRNLVLSVCDLKQHGEVPAARCGAQTVVMATRMYLHGGCDEKQTYGDLHLLEIEHMKWSELPAEGSVPPARWGHTVEAYDSDLVLFGGLVVEEQRLLDDGGRAGPVAPPFASGLAWGHSGVVNNSLYTLQTMSLQWKVPDCVGSPPSPRFYHSAVVANDLYVIFGGCAKGNFTEPLDDIHWLDLRSMQWTSPDVGGSPPPPRFGQKMIHGPQDLIFVFGGSSSPGGPEVSPATLWGFKLSSPTWSQVKVAGTPPLERVFHSFNLIGKWGFAFAGSTSTSISDLYILDVNNMRWARPLYEGQLNVRAHASTVLHDKLIIFGGVRDKVSEKKTKGPPEIEPRISRKLFFLNVLEVRSSVAEGDYKFKLVTVGDSGVGKSCLLTRFVQDFYSDFHVSTIGVDFKTVITMVKGKLVKLQLWDTAGQERFSVVTGNYYRNSDGFIFVYDATNRASFDHVDQWLNQVLQHHECGPSTIKMLVGNKADMAGEVVVSPEEAKAKAAQIGAIHVTTSAKTASNVDMVFLTAAQKLVETRKREQEQSKNSVQLGAPQQRTGGAAQGDGKKCCIGGGGGGGPLPRR